MTIAADQDAAAENSTAKSTQSSGSEPTKVETDGQAEQGGTLVRIELT